jgi:2'-5' RNA ligase
MKPTAMERQRLFIAVAVGDRIVQGCRNAIVKLQNLNNTARVSWVPSENIHLTLKFLGGIPFSEIPVIESVLNDVASRRRSIPVTLGTLGVFPTKGKVQVIWAGLEEGGELSICAQEINDTLASVGFAAERKGFVAHLTLGRVKEGIFPHSLPNQVELSEHCDGLVDEFVLFESKTLRTGSVYRALKRFPLLK